MNDRYPKVGRTITSGVWLENPTFPHGKVVPLDALVIERDDTTVERVARWLHDNDHAGTKQGEPWDREDSYLVEAYREIANDLLDACADGEQP